MTSETVPSSASVGDVLRRRWFIIVLSVIVFAGLGVAAGLRRQPVYSASAQMTVGQLNLSISSIAGFATGGQTLADGFSRTLGQPELLARAARATNLRPEYILNNVTSTPISRTSAFTIDATGRSAREAVEIANAVADSMKIYANGQLTSTGRMDRLFARYEQAVRQRSGANHRLQRLRREKAPQREIDEAQGTFNGVDLRASTLKSLYTTARTDAAQGALVTGLAPARLATNDRGSKAQLYGAFGAIAGALIGGAMALLLGVVAAARSRGKVRAT